MPPHKPTSTSPSELAHQLRWAQISLAALALVMAAQLLPAHGLQGFLGCLGLAFVVFVAMALSLLPFLFGLSIWISARDARGPSERGQHRLRTVWQVLWREAWACWRVFVVWQPWRWCDFPDDAPGHDPHPQAAVVLVHGYACNRGIWRVWMARLRARSTPFVGLSLEPVWGSIDDHVGQIEDAVARATLLSKQRPWLVCHSMGGLAVRAWLAQTPGAGERISGVVTLGTPHHGTWLSRWGWGSKAEQMQLHSAWLDSLARAEQHKIDPAWAAARVLSIHTRLDQIVFPVRTAVWPQSTAWAVSDHGHVSMLTDGDLIERCLAWMNAKGH